MQESLKLILSLGLHSFYISLIFSLLILSCTPLKSILFPYGKVLDSTSHWLHSPTLLVSKSKFSHFYLIGLISSGLLLYMNPCIVNACFFTHISRRLYECIYIAKPSKSRMHVFHYITGILFYICTPLAFNLNYSMCFLWYDTSQILGLLFFIFGSFEQHVAHVHLASLRSKELEYGLPYTRYFQWVACPHYLFEMIIYIGFAFLLKTMISILIVVWVACDLHFAAQQQYNWYLFKFKDRIDAHWKSWIPFLI